MTGATVINTTYPDGATTGEHIKPLPNGGEQRTIIGKDGEVTTRLIAT